MQQRSLTLCTLAALLVAFTSTNAVAQSVDVDVQCPTQQDSSTTPTVTIVYVSKSCGAVQSRVMSSIVGNSNQTLGGIGVFGPVVLDERMVPAGSGTTFCGCSIHTGQCDCGPETCNVDADCSACFTDTAVTTNVVIAAPPAIPESLDGTVATYLFLTEFGSGLDISTEVNECFVEVL